MNINTREVIRAIDNDNYLLITILLHNIYKEELLIEASKIGNLKTVKYIVEQGADINALHNAALIEASKKGNLEIIKFLIAKGANIHARNNAALRYASKNGHSEIVKYLESVIKER